MLLNQSIRGYNAPGEKIDRKVISGVVHITFRKFDETVLKTAPHLKILDYKPTADWLRTQFKF
jgi:hypothetical protein